ncbi:pro-interleukin-16-like, partial [Mustelus asterias]
MTVRSHVLHTLNLSVSAAESISEDYELRTGPDFQHASLAPVNSFDCSKANSPQAIQPDHSPQFRKIERLPGMCRNTVSLETRNLQSGNGHQLSHLAELRDCGVDCREEMQRGDQLNHSASLKSNMSSMSIVSLIPYDELDRLLSEVKYLEEKDIQCVQDIQVVVLHKEEGAGLGFSIAGGIDHENRMITVHKVFPSGLAVQEGTIAQGDEILSINGNPLQGLAHSAALSLLHKARPARQAIVVIRKVTEAEKATPRKGSLCQEIPRRSVDLCPLP